MGDNRPLPRKKMGGIKRLALSGDGHASTNQYFYPRLSSSFPGFLARLSIETVIIGPGAAAIPPSSLALPQQPASVIELKRRGAGRGKVATSSQADLTDSVGLVNGWSRDGAVMAIHEPMGREWGGRLGACGNKLIRHVTDQALAPGALRPISSCPAVGALLPARPG